MFASLKSLLGGGVDPAFPYSVDGGAPVISASAGWQLLPGRAKTGENVSIFVLDKAAASQAQLTAARGAVQKLKTLRHPNILRFLASSETDQRLSLATERVRPLQAALDEEEGRHEQASAWGIYQILNALAFLNTAKMVHRNICAAVVFVTDEGDWKLGGMDYLSAVDSQASDLPVSPPDLYLPPGDERGSKDGGHPWSVDMWGLGCLIWEVYNGPLEDAAQLKEVKKLPRILVPQYARLMSANPKSRPSPKQFLETNSAPSKYLGNDFISCNLFLAELAVKDASEVALFYQTLPEKLDNFPRNLCITKILPQLLQAFQYGGAGHQVLVPMLKIGKYLDADAYQARIVPCLVKLFASPSRATRINLLKRIGDFSEYLTTKVVTDDIYPHVSSGFGDTVPAMREETVKAMLWLAPKLTQNVLEDDLMKHFAKLQRDENPGIRTNTTVCLGRIAKHMSPGAREKMLAPAFLRATQDSFPHARLAGVSAMSATAEFYPPKVCVEKLLPNVVRLTLDPRKDVRDQTFRVVKTLLARLEAHAKSLPDQAIKAGQPAPVPPATTNSSDSSLVNPLLSWASGAVSGISAKLTKGEQEMAVKPSTGQGSAAPATAAGVESAATEDDDFHDAVEETTETPARGDTGSDHSDWGDADWEPTGGGDGAVADAEGWGDGDDWEPMDDGPPAAASTSKPAASPKKAMSLTSKKKGPLGGALKAAPVAANEGWDDDGGDGWNDGDGEGWGEGDDGGWGAETTSTTGKKPVEDAAARTAARKAEREAEREARRAARETELRAKPKPKRGLGAVKKAD